MLACPAGEVGLHAASETHVDQVDSYEDRKARLFSCCFCGQESARLFGSVLPKAGGHHLDR